MEYLEKPNSQMYVKFRKQINYKKKKKKKKYKINE